jgi:hypothetical protein
MNLAIVHFHLNRGGVASVIANHVLALARITNEPAPRRILLIHGGRREGWPNGLAHQLGAVELVECTVDGLDYDESRPCESSGVLASAIKRQLTAHGCVPDETVIHSHNHSLGKNVSLPGALSKLAAEGCSLLLQIHDFAEDFRPQNYARLRQALADSRPDRLIEILYPQAPRVHYAVLNQRDHTILSRAGTPPQRLHRLPNPVIEPPHPVDVGQARNLLRMKFGVPEDDRYVLYPGRGIRRKNLGEFLLWSAMRPSKCTFATTLAPINPVEQTRYQQWKSLAAELGLPCRFEVGGDRGLSLSQNLSACDDVLTTSLAEGFGLAFVEPALAGRRVIGRDLPEITMDFRKMGMRFSGLADRLNIPLDWVGADRVRAMWQTTFGRALDAFGVAPPSPKELAAGCDQRIEQGLLDFGDLDAELQTEVIRGLMADPRRRANVVELNPSIRSALAGESEAGHEECKHNVAVMRRELSLESCARRLASIYHQLVESPRAPTLESLPDGGRILDEFLGFSRFRPVRI